jgi:outer membrane protein assembly factor BamB
MLPSSTLAGFAMAVFSLACGLLIAAETASPVPSPVTAAGSWPQWRGPTRDGVLSGTDWPGTLQGKAFELMWSVKGLGPSYSGPIVSDDHVFTTETRGQKTEHVTAYSRFDGKKIWEKEWKGAMSVPFFAAANGSWIRSTPAFDGGWLYVGGIRDLLVCLNAETGEERWRVDFVKKLGTQVPAFGFVCSPLVDETGVYVQAGGAFCKVNKTNGEVIWRVLEEPDPMWGSAFSSPLLVSHAGQKIIFVQTRSRLAAVRPEDGGILWEQPVAAFRGMNILTPTLYGDNVFTSSYGGKSLLYRLPTTQGGAPELLWSNKKEGYMNSPIVIGDHVYMHLKSQRFTCIDLKTGKETWTTRQTFGKYWSMVAQGDRILALDATDGTLRLIRANPEKYELLDERKVTEEESWAHIAVAGDEVIIRDLENLSVYRWKNP